MITQNIIQLAMGIMTAEGWIPKESSLTFRNHNPGALRSSPFAIDTRDGFALFINDSVGFFALCWDLAKKCKGETRTELGPDSTLDELIKTYTALGESEELDNYIQIVKNVTGAYEETFLLWFIK